MIDLVEVRVTPRDHLPVGHAGRQKGKQSKTSCFAPQKPVGVVLSFFKHRRLRRRGFGISPSEVCPIFCKSFHVGASRS